jgi:hypothetical protein
VNDSYIGGVVRQYGNLSFSRVYDAGHQVPYYQPETAFTIFSRVIHGNDVSTGRNVDLSSFGTKGPSTSDHRNVVGPSPPSVCWIRDAAISCTEEELAGIAAGNGTVKAGIWYPTDQNIPAIEAIKQTAGASSLGLNLPFRRSRRDTAERKTINGLIGGIAAIAALLL